MTLNASVGSLSGLTVTELGGLIDGLPVRADDEQRHELLDFVRQLGAADCISGILAEICATPELAEAVAARSYRHVNHFDKIVLVDSGALHGYRLTLHLWRPPYTEKELNDEMIHDHRFCFWSHILTGRLVSHNFTRDDHGDVFRMYRYVPERRAVTTTANFYEFVGEAGLTTTGEAVEEQGNVYYLDYHRIHRVLLPRNRMTCTLVLRGPRDRDFSHVYNTVYPDTDTTSQNVMFSAGELVERIDSLRRAIGARPHAGT